MVIVIVESIMVTSVLENEDDSVRTILVVDDSAYVRRMIRFALSQNMFRILEAEDGEDAIQCFEHHSIDLLITDYCMPSLDGFALIRELRNRPELRLLPIILLTGNANEKIRKEARVVGVSAFIEKPFVPEQIAGLVAGIFC